MIKAKNRDLQRDDALVGFFVRNLNDLEKQSF